MEPKVRQNGRLITPKIDFKKKEVPIVVRTYYLQYILHIGCPENVHFFIPEGTKNACGARAATFASTDATFWAMFDQNIARVCPLDGQMRPKASKIPPKMHLKTTPGRIGCP